MDGCGHDYMKGIHLYDQESGHLSHSLTQFHTDLLQKKEAFFLKKKAYDAW